MDGTSTIVLARSATHDLLIGGLLVLGLLLVMLLVWKFVLRRFDPRRSPPSGPTAGMGIEQIEDMHRRGMISDEEFSAMRKRVLGIDEKDQQAGAGLSDDTKGESASGVDAAPGFSKDDEGAL